MTVYPEPAGDASPVGVAETVDLNPGEEARITFSAKRSGTVFRLLAVAVSKLPDAIYQIKADGTRTLWGPAAIPPTDLDDLSTVWVPAEQFDDTLTVIITDDRSSGGTRTYHAQPVGWEESNE